MGRNINLAGWWQIKFDEQDQGKELGWQAISPKDCQDINLPSCWNEVFAERFHYEGTAWYFKEVYFTLEDTEKRASLIFEGVNYYCEVFINGRSAGTHEGGFTTFNFPITNLIRSGELNLFAIRVDSRLDETTLPPSGVDWFNYGGIYRPLYIQTSGAAFLDDYTIKTWVDGRVSITVKAVNSGEAGSYLLKTEIMDQSGKLTAEDQYQFHFSEEMQETRMNLVIPDPTAWNLGASYLYTLILDLVDINGKISDRIVKPFGVREFGMKGQKVLVNGKEVKLVGCAKHDEYPLTGRTVTREQLVKDYDLLRQMNANFVRLSHSPHNRLEHELLDELGMAAISEIPMVFLREAQMTNPKMLEKSKRMLEEMIKSEKNNTSIMFWSLFIECETNLESTRSFVKSMVDLTRELDDTRLVVMASNRPLTDVTYELFDVVGVNYWEGWYGGESVEAGIQFLTTMAERYPNKPLLITSHGWEGFLGERSYIEKTPWSEDSQADYLSRIADVYMSFKNIVGEIVWTFADFRVSNWRDVSEDSRNFSYLGRPLLVNHKGMVDFYRRPKSTYFIMKKKFADWHEKAEPLKETHAQALQTEIFSNRKLAGEAAACSFIEQVNLSLAQKETLNILFASAGSQVEFLEALLRNRMFVDWSRINAFHLDEFAGAGQDTPYGFACWINDHLIKHLPFKQFKPLNGKAENLEVECERYEELLKEVEIDLACIGIGENGHLAFNDPPVADFADPRLVKIIELDPACREQQMRDGLFPDLASVPEKALTLTIPAIMRAKSILCIVPGTHKAIAVWKTIRADISTQCPATILRCHPQARLFLDVESAELIHPQKAKDMKLL